MMKRMLSVWLFSTLVILGGCYQHGQQAVDQTNFGVQKHEFKFLQKREQTTPRGSGELVIGSLERMPSFDPFGVSKKEAFLNPYELIGYRGLLSYNDQQLIVPNLASGYRVINPQKGKPIVELILPPGLRWSDGREVTTADIVFTYQTYARPDYYGIWRKQMHLVQGVSPFRSGKSATISGITQDASKRMVRITLERNQIGFMTALTAPLLPKHQLAGKTVDQIHNLSESGRIIGAGPFIIKEMKSDEWKLAPNPYFAKGTPRLKAIRIVREGAATAGPDTLQGKIHWSGVSPSFAQSLSGQDAAKASLKSAPGNGYTILGFNLQSKKVSDLSIRLALAQALSTEQIVPDTYQPIVEQVKSILPQASFAYHAGQFPSNQVKEARKTLAAKGYTKESPLTLVLTYPCDSEFRTQLVEKMKMAWADLPIQLTLKPLPHDQFVSYLFGGSPTDLYVYSWRYADDPGELQALFHSKEKVGELGLNASRYESASADKLLERGQLFLDSKERKAIFTNWQQRVAADLPILPLVQINQLYYVSSHVKGIEEPLGHNPFASIHTWWVE
ncbi:ABC transporter substrate-binding protein [Brevibacillus sp. SYSU BS000544]|uniref:ABC transporter substrate-binding protein n=1 Tax=Brevibacillus sp. SYSU BS000544 TaxID=3416443 RepID=UPI003CE49EEC